MVCRRSRMSRAPRVARASFRNRCAGTSSMPRPHAHFTLVGYDRDGLSASRRLNSRMLKQVQDLAGMVWEPHGMTRGKPKSQRIADGDSVSRIVHRSVRRLHADLPQEIERLEKRCEIAEIAAREAEQKRQIWKKLTKNSSKPSIACNQSCSAPLRLRPRLVKL